MSILDDCTVTYFPLAGRGEPVRLALVIGGVKFTDERIKGSDWPSLKADTPWGQLPVLTLKDGTKLAQKSALLALVGKLVEPKLIPADPIAAARCDELISACEDFQASVRDAGRELQGAEKEAARKECVESGAAASWLAKLDAFVGAHGSGGHAVGDALTIADLQLFCSVSSIFSGAMDGVPLDAVAKYANLQRVRKTVASLPAVVAWYDSRELAETEKAYRDARNL